MLNKTLFLEIDKPNYTPIYSVQYDYNSRFYNITILNQSQPLDLTGLRVVVAGKKPDGEDVFNSCKILDAKKGQVQLELTEQMNAVNGASEYALELFSADGMLSSQPFKLIVTRSTIPKSVESSKELGALKDALNEVQDIDNRFAQTNAQLSELANKGTTVEVLERVTKEEIDRQIADGTMANLTIADGSITQDKLSPDIEFGVTNGSLGLEKFNKSCVSFIGNNILNPKDVVRGNINASTGEYIESSTNITTNFVEIESNVQYSYLNQNGLLIHGIAWYDENENFINYGGDTSPSNAKYLRLRINTTVADDQLPHIKIMIYENKGTVLPYEDYVGYVLNQNVIPNIPIYKNEGFENGKVKDELINWKEYTKEDFKFIDEIETYKGTIVENKSPNLINPKFVIEGTINPKTGDYNPTPVTGQKSTEFIIISPNKEYMCTNATYGVVWYDENKIFIKHESMPYYNPVTPPSNAKYIRLRLNSNVLSNLMWYEYEGVKLEYVPYDEFQIKESLIKEPLILYIKDYLKNNGYLSNSNLAQLKWYILGDSISCGGDTGYQGYVSKSLGLNKVDKARMGNHMTYSEEDKLNERPGICWEVENFDMRDADIITILIGTNDWGNKDKYPLGNPDGSDGWTTFYGALHRTCNYLTSNFIGKRIGFITPPMRNISKDLIPSFMDYINAMKEVCGQYSIPVLDLWHEGGLNTFSEAVRAELIEDGLHPNTKGHAVLARPIEAFIKRL